MSEPRLELAATTRRGFLVAGLGFVMTACSKTQEAVTALPAPAWDLHATPTPAARSTRVTARPTVAFTGPVRPRTDWATGAPVPTLMDPMAPIRYITIHHDGMSPFHGDSAGAAGSRLDAIRRAHRSKHWGDIGYHYAVDRSGRVWEGRPLRYQGAHVKNHNPGNIGIVVLGNFDQQRPTQAQLEAVTNHVRGLMTVHRVSRRGLRTHLEWAPTRCPGRHLQEFMVAARSNGYFG
ncbi:MAG: peptidoglycan recognition protein family protein [Planctomycetota bacterium]|jgi:hypothetical protein